jgi:dTDP-4-amino-4,6-dideoxygalactose transaminase
MTESVIPFNTPYATGAEFDYIREAIANSHLSGNGPFAARCTGLLEQQTGCEKALLTHSCTGALEMAILLADVGPGDEVIVPSFAFASLANAVALRAATPVFVDVRPDTLALDERRAAEAITSRTRAIAPVHYAGIACEMDALLELAQKHDLVILEDAAHGLLASYRDRPLGGIGAAGCLSFHETKNVICGEGGALLVNRPDWVERAEVLQEKGTDRSRFFRGEVDRYTWVDLGSSFVMSEINAAFLWAQLERAEELTARRMETWQAYHEALADLEAQGKLRRPIVPQHCTHNAHLYYVLLEPGSSRDSFIERLEERGVRTVFHYVPLHSSPAGRRFGRAAGSFAVTDDVSERLVRLPLWVGMTSAHVERVVEAVTSVLEKELAA